MVEQFHKPQPKIESIEGIEAKRPLEKTQEAQETTSPEKIKFDQAFEKVDTSKAQIELRKPSLETEKVPGGPSLFDVAKATNSAKIQPPSPDTLKTSASSLHQAIKRPNATLISFENKGVAIPEKFIPDLNARLEHIDKALVDAKSTITGVEVAGSQPASTTESPPVRFLRYLSDADKRIDTIVSDINIATKGNASLTPEKLLSIQVKLNFAQQELEFFTNVLNRAVETVKTLMNVQI